MGNSQQMIDEVIAEQMRIAAAAEQQQQLAYQNATSQPQDCHMSDQRAIGDLPKAYNIGTPPEGNAGTLQPRETVGVPLRNPFGLIPEELPERVRLGMRRGNLP